MSRFTSRLLAGLFAVIACNAHAATETVIWENQGLVNGTTITNGQSFPSSAGSVNMVVTNGLVTDGGTITTNVTYNSGQTGNHTGYARMDIDNSLNDPDDRYSVTLTFSKPVRNLQFSLLDVDAGTPASPPNFADGIEIFYNGTNNVKATAFATLGADVIVDNETYMDGYEGTISQGTTSVRGNIALNFGTTLITSVTIVFFSTDDAQSDPVGQFIGISDPSFVTPASLVARKTWVGATVNDTAALASTGGTNNVAFNSTANSANETDTAAAINVYSGDVLSLSETLSVPAAYTQALACTGNTTALSGANLTINTADTAIVCTFTNSKRIADLAVTKSNSVASLVAGSTTVYTIRVTNNGPGSVTGAILKDPAAAGLTVTAVGCSATPGQCTGPTTPTIVQLQSVGGYALPVLANGQFYEISVTANVVATGF